MPLKKQRWSDPVLKKGYVRDGFIAEREGLFPDVEFVYKPMIPEEVDAFAAKVQANPANQSAMLVGKLISDRIVSWSLSSEPTKDNCRRLNTTLQDLLRLIISGQRATDINPDWADEDLDDIDEQIEPVEQSVGN